MPLLKFFKYRFQLSITAFMFAFSGVADAQTLSEKMSAIEQRLQQLEAKQSQTTQSLSDEIASIKTDISIPEMGQKSFMGLGEAASKVYFNKEKVSVGGYGEIVYIDPRGGSANTTDVLRFVPYLGYRFSDSIIFNSELEIEHGGVEAGGSTGEVVVEFAYLDFLNSPYFNVRLGHILVPVGLTNIQHEPTLFLSVNRPEVERNLIPSTWHENGVLFYGEAEGFRYQLGVVTSFNTSTAGNLKQASWLREARQAGAKAKAEDLGTVLRLEFINWPGVTLGGSFFNGQTGQDSTQYSAEVNLYEVHVTANYKNFDLKALYTEGNLSEAEKLSTADRIIGSKAKGYFTTLSYDVLPHFADHPDKKLPVFIQHVNYNLNDEVGTGFTADPALDKTITTFGFNYKPTAQVVLKADYEMRKNGAGEEDDVVNLGLGFVY